jgi:hypothetical protein
MLQKKLIIADRLLMLVLNLFFVLKETVAEFYYQVQITMGQGFKMIAENGGESIVQVMKPNFRSCHVRQLRYIRIIKCTLNHIIKKINNYVN